MSIPFRLRVPRDLVLEMLDHAREELPNECCGLLAGPPGSGDVQQLYRLVNALANPVEFESDPKSMFDADRDMNARGFVILAVYHSHPASAPLPSPADRERNYDPRVVNVIISLRDMIPEVRGWWLNGDKVTEAEWECVPDAACGLAPARAKPQAALDAG